MILSFILPWLGLTGLCWLLVPHLHPSALYFTKAFSMLSGLLMSALYYAGHQEGRHHRRALNITLVVIGIKMLASVFIFLCYFMLDRMNPMEPLLIGAIIYLCNTTLVVTYGYFWTLKKR